MIWIDASSRDAILSGLASAAQTRFDTDDRDLEQAAARILDWLATASERWLLVLDDLQKPDDLRDLRPPSSRYRQVVVTTRSREAAVRTLDARFIGVDTFAAKESISFLTARLANRPRQTEGAAALAEALGHHPLGLALAAAYIADNDLTCAAYLDVFDDRLRPLSQLMPDQVPDDYRGTIATTFALSVDYADRAGPPGLARALLELAALLDGNGIPESVFISSAAIHYLRTAGCRAVNAEDVCRALSCLARFNLITYDPDSPNRSVRVHALVQRAVRDTFDSRTRAKAARAAAVALLQAWPSIARDTERAAVLRASTAALRRNAGDHLWHRRSREVLFRAGNSLGERGQYTEARDYYRELVYGAHRALRRCDKFILSARFSWGHWHGEAEDPAGAAKILDALLRDATRKYGPSHPFTLSVHRSSVRWMADAGDPVGAYVRAASMVTAFRRAYPPDHPQLLYALNIQARCRAAAGDPCGAADQMAVLVDDFVHVLGPDHPDTLSARNNLARMLDEAGKPHTAVAAFSALLDDLDRIVGSDDPRTLRTRNNLARARIKIGDLTGAIREAEQLISDCVRVLGANHSETRAARTSLADARAKAEGDGGQGSGAR